MNEFQPLISIIVPVFNQERYLEKCLDSLVNQTYKNIEIILIDDGSSDGSSAICKRYAATFSCVTLFQQKNSGVSAARMVGISACRGQFIMFVDSDDWVDYDICNVLYSALKRFKADAAMCGYSREYGKESRPKCVVGDSTILTGNQIERILCGPLGDEIAMPENMECFNTLCARLYPLESIKQKKMIDLSIVGTSEDLLFNLSCAAAVGTTVYISRPLYHYRKDSIGSVTSSYKPNLIEQWNNLFDCIEVHIVENGLGREYTQALDNRIALSVLGLGLNATTDKAPLLTKIFRVQECLSDSRRRAALMNLEIRLMPLHWKVFYGCAKRGFSILVCVMLEIIQIIKRRK